MPLDKAGRKPGLVIFCRPASAAAPRASRRAPVGRQCPWAVSLGRPSFSFEAITASIVSALTERSPSSSSTVATSSKAPIAAASRSAFSISFLDGG